MRKGTMFWGTVLVIVGLLLLLDNLGLLGNIRIWSLLWPGFLILLGVWVLAGTFFKPTRTVEKAAVALEGAASARVILKHGAGKLTIQPGAGAGELVSGEFAGGVSVNTRQDGSRLAATLSVPEQIFPFSWLPGEGTLDWSVRLASQVPLALELATGASESSLDLTGLMVTDLKVETGASSTQILLPEAAGMTRVSVQAGAASVRIQVPVGVAARIRTSGGVMDAQVDTTRFPRSGGVYQSPDYETAANRAEISTEMGAGSVQVN